MISFAKQQQAAGFGDFLFYGYHHVLREDRNLLRHLIHCLRVTVIP
jgi:hypothetical protein